MTAWLVLRDFIPDDGGSTFSTVVRGFRSEAQAQAYARLVRANPSPDVVTAAAVLRCEIRYRVVSVELLDDPVKP